MKTLKIILFFLLIFTMGAITGGHIAKKVCEGKEKLSVNLDVNASNCYMDYCLIGSYTGVPALNKDPSEPDLIIHRESYDDHYLAFIQTGKYTGEYLLQYQVQPDKDYLLKLTAINNPSDTIIWTIQACNKESLLFKDVNNNLILYQRLSTYD